MKKLLAAILVAVTALSSPAVALAAVVDTREYDFSQVVEEEQSVVEEEAQLLAEEEEPPIAEDETFAEEQTTDEDGAFEESDSFEESISSFNASIPADGSFPSGFTSEQWRELMLLNRVRNSAGAGPVAAFASLNAAAFQRAKEIQNYFSAYRDKNETQGYWTVFDKHLNKRYNKDDTDECRVKDSSNVENGINAWTGKAETKARMTKANFITTGNPVCYVGLGVAPQKNGLFSMTLDFIGTQGSITGISVLDPDRQREIPKGGSIASLGMVVLVNDSVYGATYLPLDDYMVKNVNTSKNKTYDAAKVSIFGKTTTFKLKVGSGTATYIDNLDDPTEVEETIAVGQKLSAKDFFDVGSVYKTSNKSSLTVSGGTLSGVKKGVAVITSFKKNSEVKYTAVDKVMIRVVDPKFPSKVQKVSLEDGTLDVMSLLKNYGDLEPTSFKSSKKAVANFDDSESGELTLLKKGTATITVFFGEGSGRAKRTLKIKVTA